MARAANNRYGLKQGASLCLSLAKATAEITVHSVRRWYALTSAYSLLTDQEKNKVIAALRNTNELDTLKVGLVPLVALYPECPLSFLFEGQTPVIANMEETTEEFKAFLNTMFYKRGTPAIMGQANAIYIAFVTDILKFVEGVSFGNFPAIAEYPDTERIAGNRGKRVCLG